MSTKTTWRKEIESEFEHAEECWENVEFTTLTEENLDKEFYPGYGATEGCAFTLWTKERVFFPVCYDGAEWVDWVYRNPCNHASSHVGGG